MKHIRMAASVPLAALFALTGCIDDSYDLDGIDTTTELKVKNLTVPINLESIKLDKVMDLDTDDPNATIVLFPENPTEGVKQFYAVRKGGDFESDEKVIADVRADLAEPIEPTVQTLHAEGTATALRGRRAPKAGTVRFPIGKENTVFKYDVRDIDPALESLERITIEPMALDIQLESATIKDVAKELDFNNLLLQLPKGLTLTCDAAGWKYDATTGILSVPNVRNEGSTAHLKITVTAIDLAANNVKLQNHAFVFDGQLGINSGSMAVTPLDHLSLADIPTSVNFVMTYTMSTMDVTSVTGRVNYDLEGVDINPIELTDLPDFLAGGETSIALTNPQIFLNLNNPVGPYDLDCTTGLGFDRKWEDTSSAINPLSGIRIGHDRGTGPYSILIAPDPAKAYPDAAYSDPTEYTYPELRDLVKGNGLPQTIDISLISPKLEGMANGLPIGSSRPIQGVSGAYEFFAPLAIEPGSMIVYSDHDDGWSDDELDKLKVTRFSVTANAYSDLPCGVKILVKPLVIDERGQQVAFGNGGMGEVPAYADGQKLDITIECSKQNPITHLDGIHYEATAISADGTPLDPEQNIRLDNIRVTVSGSYITDFD